MSRLESQSGSGENAADCVEEIPFAELSPVEQPVLPLPNLLLAIGLCFAPVLAQLLVGVGIGSVAVLAFVLITRRPQEAQAFLEGIQVYLFPIGTLTTLGVALGVAGLFYRRNTGRFLAWRGVSLLQLVLVVLITVPLAVLASEVTNCVAMLLRQIEPKWLHDFRESGGRAFEEFVDQPFLLVFLAGCLLPGLGEEIYCRGFLSRGLVARYGVVLGTLFASFLFAAMHVEPVQSCGAFVLGIGLQFVFLATRSLAAPIVLHTLNNTLAFIMMRYADRYPVPGLSELPDGSVVHTPMLLMGTALVSLAVLLALLFQTRTQWKLSDGSHWSPGYITAECPPNELGARPVSGRPNVVLLLIGFATYAVLIWAIFQANLSVAQ